MITLKSILNSEYTPNDAKEALNKLIAFGFENHLNSCISLVSEKIKNEQEEIANYGCIQLASLASNLLSGINEKIRILKHTEEPENISLLESILGSVSKCILVKIFLLTKSDNSKLIIQIANALDETCTVFGYDQEVVFKQSGLVGHIETARTINSGDKINIEKNVDLISHYQWNGKPEQESAFIEIFIDRKLIANNKNKNIHKLFKPSNYPLNINFNSKEPELVMTFFYHVKKMKLLTVRNNSGFYHPLFIHGLDFQKNILQNKSAKDFNDLIKKREAEWSLNTVKVEKWLNKFKQ